MVVLADKKRFQEETVHFLNFLTLLVKMNCLGHFSHPDASQIGEQL